MLRAVLNCAFASQLPPSTPPAVLLSGLCPCLLASLRCIHQLLFPLFSYYQLLVTSPVNCCHSAPQRKGIAVFPKCIFLLRELDTFPPYTVDLNFSRPFCLPPSCQFLILTFLWLLNPLEWEVALLLTLLPDSAGEPRCLLTPYRNLFCPKLHARFTLPLVSSSVSGCPLNFTKLPFFLQHLNKMLSGALLSFTFLFHLLLVTSTEERCTGNLKVHQLTQLQFNLSLLPLPSHLLWSSAILIHHFISLFQYSLLA